jgi:hypothetical protein
MSPPDATRGQDGGLMANADPTQLNRPTLNPTALSVADTARLLTAAGGQLVTAEMIQRDIASSAPTNADGTINLVHYTAWLAMQMSARDRRSTEFGEVDAPFAQPDGAVGDDVTSNREEEKSGVGD